MSKRDGQTETAGRSSAESGRRRDRVVLPRTDVFGRIVHDYHRNRLRDEPARLHADGRVTPADPGRHFRGYDGWSRVERAALDRVRGRVLDLGCGAGRHARWLQRRGEDVLAVDDSPGAVRTASERGVERCAVTRLDDLAVSRARFDAVTLLGTRFGARDYPVGMRSTLSDLYAVTAADGQAVLDVEDPHEVERAEPVDRWDGDDGRRGVYGWPDEGPASYARRWYRVSYGDWTGRWTRLAMLTPAQLRAVVAGTRWRVGELLRDRGEPRYAVVLEK
ncbi:hypothetical protein BRD18_01655 [Halobacteriales archaeon SW_7_71_33]|nr:MAG: hypothetical protein BRD18_01655 [Halobacteriales archaeon SW_7_71_33]